MKTEEMTNIEVVNAMKLMDGSMKEKKLPIKLSYAIRRSMASFKAAYDPYMEALQKLCDDYGCTVNNLSAAKKEDQANLTKEINDLLSTKTTVEIYPVDIEVVEECGNGRYDPLTYEEIDSLWWIIDDESDEPIAEVVDEIPE